MLKKQLILTNFSLVMYKVAEKYQCPVQYLYSLTSSLAIY